MNTGLGFLKAAAGSAFVILAMAAMAAAQNGGPRGGFGGGGMGRGGVGGGFALLQIEAVQKDLKLTEEQKSEISALAEELRDLPREERLAKAAETRQKVEDLLQPEQKERLAEIGLQMAGGRALTRPEIAKKLGLSDDQRDKLDDLFPPPGGFGTPSAPPRTGDGPAGGGPAGGAPSGGGAGARGAGGGAGTGGAGGGQSGNMRAARDEMNAKAMEILTPEQRTEFEKMQGKKIDVDPSELFRGGRGQGGQGGPAGQGGKGDKSGKTRPDA